MYLLDNNIYTASLHFHLYRHCHEAQRTARSPSVSDLAVRPTTLLYAPQILFSNTSTEYRLSSFKGGIYVVGN